MAEALIAELRGPLDLHWITRPLDAEALGSTQIYCETKFSAISPGTELAAYAGAKPLRPGPVYPRVVGYCNVAEIVKVGPEVSGYRPGQLILTHQSHRSHFICDQVAVLAVVDLQSDPSAISVSYLFHLGYSALLKASFRPGHSVGVVGLGAIGLATLALVATGGGVAYGFSDQEDVAERAMAFGASSVRPKIDTSGELDIVALTSNRWSDWRVALSAVRKGGVVAVLGFPGRDEERPPFNPLDSQFLYDKQLTIMGCGQVPNLDAPASDCRFTLKRNIEYLVSRVGRGELPAERLISQRVAAPQLEEVYRRLLARERGLVSAVLVW